MAKIVAEKFEPSPHSGTQTGGKLDWQHRLAGPGYSIRTPIFERLAKK
jgi:hypothetical protein